MRRAAFRGLGFFLFALLTTLPAAAQTPDSVAPVPPAALTREVITSYAKMYVAVSAVRDSVHLELAQARNKTPQAQAQLQQKLRDGIAQVLKDNSVTEEEYRRLTTIVASDPGSRRIFDELIAAMTKKT
jgi:hypothetical protein